MKNITLGIILMITCTFFTAFGEFLFKLSAKSFQWHPVSLLTNYTLILAFAIFFLGSVLLIIALRFGDLSVLYPFIALNFIWVMLISFWWLGEYINRFKIGAAILVVFGVVLIAKGGGESE